MQIDGYKERIEDIYKYICTFRERERGRERERVGGRKEQRQSME